LAEENQGIRRRIAERRRRSEDAPVAVPPLSPVQVRAGELRHDLESAAAAAKLRSGLIHISRHVSDSISFSLKTRRSTMRVMKWRA
jgi:hypothetical protein